MPTIADDPFKPDTLDDKEFIDEVNKFAGFDVTKRDDSSVALDEDKRMQLRALWKQRKDMDSKTLKSKIENIFNTSNKPLFR